MFNISPYLYSQIYYWVAFCLCAFIFFRYSQSSNNKLLLQQNTYIPALLLCVLAILFLGLRPTHYVFADMVTYAKGYREGLITGIAIEAKGEWAFALLQQICLNFHLKENIFFLICAIAYILTQYWSCKRLLWENVWIAMLFILSAFEFYVFAVNGIRNGMACSLVMMAMTLLIQSEGRKKQIIIAAIISIFAYGIHRSVIIPILCAIVSYKWIKEPRKALWIWLLSIPVSLVFGSFFLQLTGDMMSGEERYRDYTHAQTESTFSHTGFRWDFLLYSSMPVVLTWYVSIKRNIHEKVFNFLSCTYLLANSFWILVISANYSNRFAYLSWFLYPLVLAYGLIRLKIWEDQDRKIGFFLLAHAGFTLTMFLIGKL